MTTDTDTDVSTTTEEGQAGGSPPNPNSQGDGAKVDETTSSGDESSESGGEKNTDTADKELRQKLTEQSEQLAGYQDLVKIASEHPDWNFKQIMSYVQTGNEPSAETDDTDPFEDLYTPLVGDNKDNHKFLRQFAERVSSRTEQQILRKLSPIINKTVQSDVDDRFNRGVRSKGVDPEDHEEELTKFRRDFIREQGIKFDDPVKEGRFVGEAFAKKMGIRGDIAKQKKDLEFRKGAMMEERGSKGQATKTAANTVTLSRGASMAQIRPYVAAGKKIIWKD